MASENNIPLSDAQLASRVRNPSRALKISMAMRLDHGFGIPNIDLSTMQPETEEQHKRRQEVLLQDIDRMFEEISGNGFYSPEQEAWYLANDKAAQPTAARSGERK